MTETLISVTRSAATQWGRGRITVEAMTLAALVVPPIWLALHWPWIPAVSPHLHHGKMFLWVMPAYALAVYLMLSESGLPSKMDILRRGHRLSRLRPIFVAYFLTARVEVLAFLAVLSLAMDQTAITGRVWAAKGFLVASLTVIAITILLFTIVSARASYRLSRPSA